MGRGSYLWDSLLLGCPLPAVAQLESNSCEVPAGHPLDVRSHKPPAAISFGHAPKSFKPSL